MEKLEDVLSTYDNIEKKGFIYTDVSYALSKICEEGETKKLCNYEKMAFSFVEKTDREKGEEYFSPIYSFRDPSGNIVDVPSKEEITLECIEYWKKRSHETHNPMMKARYVGLLFEYQEEKAHIKKEKVLIDSYMDSLLLSVEGCYPSNTTISICFLDRTFELDFLSGKENTKRIKKVFYEFVAQKDNDNSFVMWKRSFILFSKYKDLFSLDEHQEWVDKQHKHLEILCSKSNRIDVINEQVDVMISYYVKEKDTQSIELVMRKMYAYLHREENSMGVMMYLCWLDELQKKYFTHGIKNETYERLLKEISEKSPENFSEMGSSELIVDIPAGFWTEFEKYLIGEGNIKMIMKRFTCYFIPKKEERIIFLKDLTNIAPLQYIAIERPLDENGLRKAEIKPIEEDFEKRLSMHYEEFFITDAPRLKGAIKILKKKNVITLENLMAIFAEAPYIDNTRLPIIKEGVKAYLQEDYLVAIHLLIPQIEETVRFILETNGGVKIKPKNDAYQLRTFDDILRDPIILNSMGEDICYYFQQVFTNVVGLNLRNTVCHGILAPEKFGVEAANLVFHALLTLGLCLPEFG